MKEKAQQGKSLQDHRSRDVTLNEKASKVWGESSVIS
jgi:hypothetical protein